MNYLIIGNSAAGIGAIEGIRKNDKQGKITVISDENYHTYSRPLISYYLAGKVEEVDMNYRPADFYKQNNVETRLGVKVTKVNTDKQVVILEDETELNFDRLLIASGGSPIIPSISGSNKDNIYTFITLDDSKVIAEKVKEVEGKEVIILGAGLIGLKAAEALVKRGLKVTVVELADRILSAILDQEAAKIVRQYLEAKGINFILEDTIEKFIGDKKATSAKLKSGEELACDLAIIAVGVKPNTEFIKNTNLEINDGIVVSNKLETNLNNIYAAGDVAEGYDMVQEKNAVIPIWPNAYNQGLVAGKNMAGTSNSYQEGFARNSIEFFGLPMITAGIINSVDKQYEVLINKSITEKYYKKVVLDDNKIIGFIYLNNIARAGILTGLIKEEKDIGKIKDKLLTDEFGYVYFDEQQRKEKILE